MYVPRFRSGVPAALDFAVTSGLQSSVLHLAAQSEDAATMRYEGLKSDHLDTKSHCESEGITFVPMVVEASGGSWGPEARKIWSRLAKHQAQATGESQSFVANQLLQNMGITLHRENARAVLRRAPRAWADPGVNRLSAAVTLAAAAAAN